MAKKTYEFGIDDGLGTRENLVNFAQLLGQMDAPLAAALSPYLAQLAAGSVIDNAVIWNALHAATAVTAHQETPESGDDREASV